MDSMLVVGGDRRYACLARLARKRGWRVHTVALPESEAWLGQPDVIVLPNPWRIDGGRINAPLSDTPLYWVELERLLADCRGALIVCGGAKPGDSLVEFAGSHGSAIFDIFKDEAFARANAVASAEGAIFYAMRDVDHAISGSRCLVVGYGRIGELLAAKLRGLGADVCVAARRYESRVWARCHGHLAIPISALSVALEDRNLVFNTVPNRIFGERELTRISSSALLIDLSSPPYGVDFDMARELGVNARLEPNIPGRYSPVTAAVTLLDSIEAAYSTRKEVQ